MFRKKLQQNVMAAVCPSETGVAVARVRRHKKSGPTLDFCESREIQNLSLQGAEIARLTKQHHLDRQACITTLDLGTYHVLIVDVPDVPEQERKAAIRWSVKDLIDFNIDDAVIDVFETPNQRTAGNGIMTAVVGRAETVRHQIDLMKQSGLALTVVDIPEMAMRNVAALLPEDVAGMALIYLGANEGLITITRQQTLYLSRRIETGYQAFAVDVESGDESRLQQKMDDIVVEIQRSMDYYERHFSQPALTSVAIAPSPVVIPGLEKYIQSQLGVVCRVLDVNAIIDAKQPVSVEAQAHCFLAIGAALRDESEAQ